MSDNPTLIPVKRIHCTILDLAMFRTVRALRLLLVTNLNQKAKSAHKFKVKPGSFTDISPPISYTPIPIRQGLWKISLQCVGTL